MKTALFILEKIIFLLILMFCATMAIYLLVNAEINKTGGENLYTMSSFALTDYALLQFLLAVEGITVGINLYLCDKFDKRISITIFLFSATSFIFLFIINTTNYYSIIVPILFGLYAVLALGLGVYLLFFSKHKTPSFPVKEEFYSKHSSDELDTIYENILNYLEKIQ